MNSIQTIYRESFPPLLKEMVHPPKCIHIRGVMPSHEHIFLTVVGARRFSSYGKEVTEKLITSLRGLPVVIVSGLAFGIDAIAHRTALEVGLPTIAVPGSGLDDSVLYPRENVGLAEEILRRGGALLSHFDNTMPAAPWTFPDRNRIMAGLSHATLVIEADLRSGTLITSKFAGDFNRNVLAVPGSIFNSKSAGPHMLIKTGATPITCGEDLITALGFKGQTKLDLVDPKDLTAEEKLILSALTNPLSRDELCSTLNLDATEINISVSMLEIKGLIEEKMSKLQIVK